MGWPVLAIESVPGSLENLAANSSLMLPPPERVSVPPVFRFLNEPSGGPPVPARCDFGSFEYGQPNWSCGGEPHPKSDVRRELWGGARVRAHHEVGDHAVEVEAVVEARVGLVDEV